MIKKEKLLELIQISQETEEQKKLRFWRSISFAAIATFIILLF